jgi:hypothetical protein
MYGVVEFDVAGNGAYDRDRLFTMPFRLIMVLSLSLCVSCSRSNKTADKELTADSCPIQLRDVTGESGVTFVHDDGSSGQRYIVETITAGLALFDYDGDGLQDIYYLIGALLKGADDRPPPRNALYRNEGKFRFRDVTMEAGVGDTGYGLGVAVADYNNDGLPDVYVNNYGPNVLYLNNGDGTFSDVTASANVATGDVVGAGACFLDADQDGLLDLYVANYVDFTYDTHLTHRKKGYETYAGPRAFNGVPDVLYRNNGDGTFSDVSEEAGIAASVGTGMGIVAADYDLDGDTDVFVLNDVSGNFLFVNDGQGHFSEDGVLSGAAYNMYGLGLGSMGIDCGDFDNDGWPDFLMTSFQGELPVLYRNRGDGTLDDVTTLTGVGEGSAPYVNWGVGLVDFDNDGDLDVFIANGHLQDLVDAYDDSTAYEVHNLVLMNNGTGRFVDVSSICGDGASIKRSSRGAVFDDLDNDGDVDAVVLNARSASTVIRNESATDHHWLKVDLRGRTTNRYGVGSLVEVTAGKLKRVAEVHSGRGYQSHYGLQLHFGLGEHAKVDRIRVRWLGGQEDVLTDVDADQVITIVEGASRE